MDSSKLEPCEEIRKWCLLAGIDINKFLEEVVATLEVRVRNHLIPNEQWFNEGKTYERYWAFLESITKHKWDPEVAWYWFQFLRDPAETREEIPIALRYQVLERDKYTCQKCGRKKAPDVEVHIDHKLPWSYGGQTTIDNLQVLCEDCNEGKSNKYIE